MNQFLGLRTSIYRVSDIEKAKEWYSELLGFAPYFDEPFYVGFNVGGFELGLHPEEQAIKTKSEGVNTYWGVENVSETFQRLLELGATEFEKPTEVGGGIITALVKDPWGNLLGIIYNPHFKLPVS
jgi:lactoylglutathione lyase